MVTSFTDWDSGIHLAHHGIKGQKWGVRKYQNPDGTLTAAGRARYGYTDTGTGGNRRAQRAFNKEAKRLARYGRRADIDLQRAISAKYGKRAKIAGLGALGLAGAAAGSHAGTVKGIKNDIKAWDATWHNADKESSEVLKWLSEHTGKNATLGNEHMMRRAERAIAEMKNASAQKAALKKVSSFSTAPVSTRTKILAGAAAATGGYAAYNAIRSKIAKHRTTEAGHKKAVEKYKSQYEKMTKQFANTPYSELLRQQRQMQQQRQKQKKKVG